ncbi:hypothetical protein WAF17_21155 [Bernardetia sp. ABR2-2B]|uniref:hypothetical protein n=1 Tax=Bernardetia sp. ABR2-2B TaxID=3127472 RepID=UPI0030CC20F2
MADFAKILSEFEFKVDDTAIKNAEEYLKKLNKTINESKEGSLEWTEAMRKSEKLQEKLAKAVRASENSIDGLENSISDLTKAQRKLDLSTEKGRKQFKDYEDQINKKKKSLDSYQESLGKTSKSSNGLGSSLGGLATKAGLVGAALFVGEKALEFGRYLVDIDKKYSTLFATVQRFSGLQGTTLQNATSDVVALAETYGKTEDEILKSTKNFADAYGISFTEALDLVEKGFLKGADTTGDFLSLLEEYPVQFKNANVSAQDFIKTVSTGAQTGSSFIADKLPDTIKELGLRLRELDKAQLEALSPLGKNFSNQIQKDLAKGEKDIISIFKSIVDEAQKVGLTTQQTQKLIADLGGGALEDLGGLEKAYELITKAQNSNLDSLDELGKKQQKELETARRLAKEEAELAATFEGLSKNIDEFYKNAKANGIEFLNSVIQTLDLFDAIVKKSVSNNLANVNKLTREQLEEQIKDREAILERQLKQAKQYEKLIDETYNPIKLVKFRNEADALDKSIKLQEETLKGLRSALGFTSSNIDLNTKASNQNNDAKKEGNKLTDDQIKKLKEARQALSDLTQTLEFQLRQNKIDLLPNNEESLELQFQLDTDKLLSEYSNSIKEFKEKAKSAGLSEVEIEAGIRLREDLLASQIDLTEKTLSKGIKKIANDISAAFLEVDKLRVARFKKANDEILSDTERSESERLQLLAANTQAEIELLDKEQQEARRLLDENIEDEELKNILFEKLDLEFAAKRKDIYSQTAQDVQQINLDSVENARSIVEDGLALEEELLREKLLTGELTERQYRDALLETRKFRVEQLIETLNSEEELESTSAARKREIAIEVQQLRNDLYEEDVENQKKAEDEKQSKLQETLAIVEETFGAIFSVLNELVSQQIEALDELTDRQRKRVEDAEKIAEKGNAALLEQEQKRLDELEAKRQRSVERQRGIAAAEALINAISAIVQGAAQGGLAGIAAVIGGVGAGIVAITQIVSGAFKDGVVDFKGKGGERSDSNIVAISNRESIITAKGTRNAKGALKLINEGKLTDRDIFNTPNYTLTPEMYMPVGADMRGMEERLDMLNTKVEGLTEAVKVDVQNNMGISKEGVFEMTSKVKRKIERRNTKR